MEGQDALQFSVRMVLAQTEMILKSLPGIVEAHGIDALIIDTVQFYAELGALRLDMPYVHVANGLHWDHSGYTPLACMAGLMRQLPLRWPETGKVSHSGLMCSQARAGASGRMRKASDLESTGKIYPLLSPRGHQLPKRLEPSTLKVRIGRRNSTTPVHSMMVKAERKWTSLGIA